MTRGSTTPTPAAATFDAVVERALRRTRGGPRGVLDRTAFYPTSGGQPFDIGVLGGSTVVDVVDDGRRRAARAVVRRSPQGAGVHGEIDWARRFDHMQQHTGQHVLSAAFVHVCDARP